MEVIRWIVAIWATLRLWRATHRLEIAGLGGVAVWMLMPVALHTASGMLMPAMDGLIGVLLLIGLAIVSHVVFRRQRAVLQRQFPPTGASTKRRVRPEEP